MSWEVDNGSVNKSPLMEVPLTHHLPSLHSHHRLRSQPCPSNITLHQQQPTTTNQQCSILHSPLTPKHCPSYRVGDFVDGTAHCLSCSGLGRRQKEWDQYTHKPKNASPGFTTSCTSESSTRLNCQPVLSVFPLF